MPILEGIRTVRITEPPPVGNGGGRLALAPRVAQPLALPNVLLLLAAHGSAGAGAIAGVLNGQGLHTSGQVHLIAVCVSDLKHRLLHVNEELLLLPADTSRPAKAIPRDPHPGRELKVLHCVEADEGARPTEACFAMDRYWATSILAHVEEGLDLVRLRARAIGEVQVSVLEAILHEALAIVVCMVQAHDQSYSQSTEYFHVVLRLKRWVTISVEWLSTGSKKGEKLSGDNPIHVCLVRIRVVLVPRKIKGREVNPPELHRLPQSTQAVEDREVESTRSRDSVPEGQEGRVDVLERSKGLIGCDAVNAHPEGTDEEGGVGPLPWLMGTIVNDALPLHVGIHQLEVQEHAEPVHLAKVQWPKVVTKGHIYKGLINGEVVRLRRVSWRFAKGRPEQAAWQNFYGVGDLPLSHGRAQIFLLSGRAASATTIEAFPA
mmetsp:Transcript_54244/g.129292  ORF Transcript_54244/g.129292 Transcript_54244/m.129292 type:complete len:433 (+) Transcript_54244:399-1697(+)